jgi:hypothetical protein
MRYEILKDYPDSSTEQKWLEFLKNSSYSSHYTSPGYHKMPYWEGSNPFSVLVFDEEDRVVAVACSLNVNRQINAGLAVRPQVAFAKNADEMAGAQTLFDGLMSVAGNGGELITLHSMTEIKAFEELGFSSQRAEGPMEVVVLDLAEGSEALFKDFSQTRRSDIRKALRENKMEIGPLETMDELKQLHDIHLGWCEFKEIEPDSFDAFKTAWEQQDYLRILIAKTGDKVIAGSIFRFCDGGLVEYSANCSLPEFQGLRPNDVIVWKAIEWASENNFSYFSMGGSHLFLRRFGGSIWRSYQYRIDLTLFKKHLAKEAISNAAIKAYQSLSPSARKKIKKVLGRS